MSISDKELQKALHMVSKNQRMQSVLKSAQALGITTLGFAKLFITDEELTIRALRETIDYLVAPSTQAGNAPLLVRRQPRLFGNNGRPENVEVLNELGAAVLNEFVHGTRIKAPQIRDQWDLTHRYIILKGAGQAKKEGLDTQIEHVLKNKSQEVRADLYLEINGLQIVIEVEQKLLRRNLKRAEDKFMRWATYIREDGSSGVWRIYLVLNARKRDLPTLIRYWQEAFEEAKHKFGELPYDVFYITVSDLMQSLSFTTTLQNADFLEEIDEAKNAPPIFLGEENQHVKEEPQEELPDYISPEKSQEFQDTLRYLIEAQPNQALLALSRLASVIYSASFYPDSPTLKVAVFPWASIWLMHRYLEHPRMAGVKAELSSTLNRIHKRTPGMVMLRDTVTSLLWDVLLFHHGLGRGGALHVIFQVPDFQDLSSDFRVEVRVNDKVRGIGQPEIRALSWFFTSIYLYRHHLKLIKATKK